MKIKISIILILAIILFVVATPAELAPIELYPQPEIFLWPIRSIDTMKQSRDRAREKLSDASFDETIQDQIRKIAATGASHVAIATPYDREFEPFLKRWIRIARENGLSVWFRGNWSGWEQWFSYPPIDQAIHLTMTKSFIINNPDLFEDGDIFEPCPECENGALGDPRFTNQVQEYKEFLILLNQSARAAFNEIEKNVITGIYAMNGDVANLIMDQETTKNLEGKISIDHYVKSTERLKKDIISLSDKGSGQVILSEFGAPIPDIHGELSDGEQAVWIRQGLDAAASSMRVIGLNYWVGFGGSTELWDSDGNPSSAVKVMTDYFKPQSIYGVITDELNQPIASATVGTSYQEFITGDSGYYQLPWIQSGNTFLIVKAKGYWSKKIALDEQPNAQQNISLSRKIPSLKVGASKLFYSFKSILSPA
jgi:hypothetical protein